MILPLSLILEYYDPKSLAYQVLIQHSIMVTAKSLEIAKHWNANHPEQKVNEQFIHEAAMLHDIGIYGVNFPEAGCTGTQAYICHGRIGYDILMEHGLPKHAQVAISHTGVGISHEEVRERNMPLSLEYIYMPQTIEEKIISYADLFYSKANIEKILVPNSIEKARASVTKFWEQNGIIFDERFTMFENYG
jgi:uncharacterized protein